MRPRHGCQKQPFRTRAEAQQFIEMIAEKRKTQGREKTECRWYFHAQCGKYHTTSQPPDPGRCNR